MTDLQKGPGMVNSNRQNAPAPADSRAGAASTSSTKTASKGVLVGRIIGFVIVALVVIAAIVAFAVTRARQNSGSAASSSQTQASATPSKSSKGSTATPTKSGRTLVVIFSSKTAIYGLSHPAKIGNTMRIANMIVADTGADKYEIVPTKPYGNYNQTVSLAQKEQN